MNYCEKIQILLKNALILSEKLLSFHMRFGKKYVTELLDELKISSQVKKE